MKLQKDNPHYIFTHKHARIDCLLSTAICLKIALQTWIYLPLGEYLKFEIRLNLFFLYLNSETKLPISYKSV